jgi:FtsP/CotA-like multicopper oxidase with cupredoxin domain
MIGGSKLALSRRGFIVAAAAAGGAAWLGGGRSPAYGRALGLPPEPISDATVSLALTAAERPTALPCFAGRALPLWTLSEASWLPVIRMPIGARLDVALDNRLPREGENASIHWHGIRLPNDQDGVPYLVQDPVFPGGSYRYSFVPPDTGTFFFHTHCNTAEHLGRGLMGVLMRDWRVDLDAGAFLPFTTNRGAARAGTFGTLRTVNGAVDPELRLPASADCRLRLLNLDPTRVVELGLDGADAAIVAVDGVAVIPFPLDRWSLGPAMRIDIIVRSPTDGRTVRLLDHRPEIPVQLASFRARGSGIRRGPFSPAPLRGGLIPVPDLANAEPLDLSFGSTRPGLAQPIIDNPLADLLGPLCLSSSSFWTIGGASWPGGDHTRIPPPLAELQLGRTYRVSLRNETQLLHPVHIHGHTFTVLRSDRRSLPVHHADTVLLESEETVEVAFVADNPGKWMIHCHVAEHQETGMMGYFTVG